MAPIHDIERLNRPIHYQDKTPRNRPSSLIIPANIGIRHPPKINQNPQIAKFAPPLSHTPTHSSHQTFLSDEDDIVVSEEDIVENEEDGGQEGYPLINMVLTMITNLHFLIHRKESFQQKFWRHLQKKYTIELLKLVLLLPYPLTLRRKILLYLSLVEILLHRYLHNRV